MKPYKSIFKESIESLEVSANETKQLVNISNLVWSKDTQQLTWVEAMNSAPSGWKLPTIQQLYTALNQNVLGFQSGGYWSSSTYPQFTNVAWGVNFSKRDVGNYFKYNTPNMYAM